MVGSQVVLQTLLETKANSHSAKLKLNWGQTAAL
jgi:hypothetical protein